VVLSTPGPLPRFLRPMKMSAGGVGVMSHVQTAGMDNLACFHLAVREPELSRDDHRATDGQRLTDRSSLFTKGP
jgi:hypothetical protein